MQKVKTKLSSPIFILSGLFFGAVPASWAYFDSRASEIRRACPEVSRLEKVMKDSKDIIYSMQRCANRYLPSFYSAYVELREEERVLVSRGADVVLKKAQDIEQFALIAPLFSGVAALSFLSLAAIYKRQEEREDKLLSQPQVCALDQVVSPSVPEYMVTSTKECLLQSVSLSFAYSECINAAPMEKSARQHLFPHGPPYSPNNN